MPLSKNRRKERKRKEKRKKKAQAERGYVIVVEAECLEAGDVWELDLVSQVIVVQHQRLQFLEQVQTLHISATQGIGNRHRNTNCDLHSYCLWLWREGLTWAYCSWGQCILWSLHRCCPSGQARSWGPARRREDVSPQSQAPMLLSCDQKPCQGQLIWEQFSNFT